MDLRLTDIFFKNLDAYTAGENLIINQGSTGSSKTWSILQLLAFIARQAEEPLVTSVVSYALPHLKMGAIRDFDRILLDMGYNPGDICNKSEYTYRLGRSTIEFFGIEGNLAKVHGPRRDILYINEANKKITYDIFDQMHTRTRKCTIMDFNPTAEFWVHTEVMPNFPHAYIHSTWRDNTYLSDIERQKILNKYDKPGFENWVRVYGEGEIGILEGQIFTNWTVGEFDSTLPYGFGLDFGYHPDPDAMVRVAVDERRRKIYMDECFYNTGQSTDDLRKAVLRAVPSATSLIIADCADPRTITDLRKKDGPARLGLNVMPVKKDGTVSEWLKKMQGYELVITETSYNLQKEINNYIWSDTKAGIPIDAFNHCFEESTPVITRQGIKAICEILPGEYILTSAGYCKVINNGITGRNQIFVYKLKFSNFVVELKCTSSHLIKTTKGWKQIKELDPGNRIFLHRSLTEKHTDFIREKNTTQEAWQGSTLLYGNFIKGIYRKDFMCIIKTVILQITKLKIWNWLNQRTIFQSTERKDLNSIKHGLKNSIQKVLNLQKDGINQKRERNGILIMREYPMQKDSPKNGYVNIVKNLTSLKLHSLLDFVPLNAKLLPEGHPALITHNAFVRDVENLSFVENTQNKDFVLTAALQNIESSYLKTDFVWDLTVAKNHEFFANGILVHNCIDAARYYFMFQKQKINTNVWA